MYPYQVRLGKSWSSGSVEISFLAEVDKHDQGACKANLGDFQSCPDLVIVRII